MTNVHQLGKHIMALHDQSIECRGLLRGRSWKTAGVGEKDVGSEMELYIGHQRLLRFRQCQESLIIRGERARRSNDETNGFRKLEASNRNGRE